MVRNRKEKYYACKEKGYTLYTFRSRQAIIYSDDIGEGTLIYPNCFVGPHTSIGVGCFLENGVSVAHDTSLGDFVFCGPRANICGDNVVGSNCFIGGGATVAGIVTLGERTLVAAGATCTKNTSEGTICFSPRTIYTTDKIPEELI